MKVKRQKPDAIKSYFIEYPNSIKGKGVSFHILNEKRGKKNNFIFLLSRTDGEVSLPEFKDVFATITTDDSSLLKPLLNYIGHSVQIESRRNDRPSHDHDIVFQIENKIKNLNAEVNVSKNASKFITQAEKLKIEKNKNIKTNKKEYTDEEKEYLKVRPYALLKTLHDNGIINISREEPNGDELKVKFEFSNQAAHGNKKFNISVAKLDASAGNKSQLFNDFSNQKNKGLGMNSIALIAHLGEYGLFDFNDFTNDDKISYSKEYFKENILPRVPEELKMEHNDDGGKSLYFNNKTVTFQPIKRDVPHIQKTMSDFLQFRNISKDTIDSLIENDNLIFGDFYNSRITVEYDSYGNEKKNYGYKNAPYFRLHDGWLKPGYKLLNKPYGAERFEVKRTPTGQKPFEYDKKNIGSVDGRYWSYGNQHNPERAVIHEAIIDGLSSLELFKESGIIDPDKQRYFSIQGTNHMKRFLSKNIGFWTETKKVKGTEETISSYQEFKEFKNPLDDFTIEQYKEKIGHKEIIFFKYPETSSKKGYIENNLKEISRLFGTKLTLIDKKERSDVFFDDFKDKDTILVDEYNYSDFLDSIKLNIFYNKKENKYNINTVNQRFYNRPLNDFNKNKIKKNIKQFFGTDHLVFGMDNDHAGLKLLRVFTEMERHLGIPVSYMIPNDIASDSPYENYKGLSLKDFHKQYIEFVKEGAFNNAYELLDKYISQKPDIDNNDVLKKYNQAKKDNPDLARELIESKISQLTPVHSPDGLNERNESNIKKNQRIRSKKP